jgi:hypothetical protein
VTSTLKDHAEVATLREHERPPIEDTAAPQTKKPLSR